MFFVRDFISVGYFPDTLPKGHVRLSYLLYHSKYWSNIITCQNLSKCSRPAAKRQKVAPSPKVTGRATSGQKNFAAIHKIVNHMKSLHLSGETRQLTLTEILEECHSQTLGKVP